MKKAAFINVSKATVDRVYYAEMQRKLRTEFDFTEGCFGIGEMERNPEALLGVEYAFSTWGMPRMTEEQIKKYLPSLKAVFYGAGSVQDFAREFLACGIAVFSGWGANGIPVAEFTMSQILLATKGYFQRFHRYANSSWVNRAGGLEYIGNFDTKIGIIGAGMIGRLVINLLKNFRLKIYVWDPFLPQEAADELGVVKVEKLAELFGECEVISNHLANNAQTVGMIDKECFGRMKPNAAFINTGRGAQVVEADLIAALKEEPGRIALLDVTYPEPPRPGSELYSMDNVFLSPHIAGPIGHEVWRLADYMFEECKNFDAGLPTRFHVTESMLATMA